MSVVNVYRCVCVCVCVCVERAVYGLLCVSVVNVYRFLCVCMCVCVSFPFWYWGYDVEFDCFSS